MSNVVQPMERVKALINLLQEQAQQNAGPAVLLSTLQQLQLELTGGVAVAARQLGTAKVAVVMPNHSRFMPPVSETTEVITESFEKQVHPVPAAALQEAPHTQVPSPVHAKAEENGWLFDPMKEIPTLTHQANVRELNDMMGQGSVSLNDRLKTEKTELAAMLVESPIRDLKKGIDFLQKSKP